MSLWHGNNILPPSSIMFSIQLRCFRNFWPVVNVLSLSCFSEKGPGPAADAAEEVSRQGFWGHRHRPLDDLVERRGPQLVSRTPTARPPTPSSCCWCCFRIWGEFEVGQNELNQFYLNRNSRKCCCPSCLLTDSNSRVGSKGRFWATLTAFYFGRFSILQPKTGSTPSHKSWLRPFRPIVNFASKRSQVRLFSTNDVASSFPRNVVVIFVEGANSVIPGVYLKKGESPQHKIVLM